MVLVAALVVVVGTARLGWWQLDRAHQKLERQSAIEQRQGLPALQVEELDAAPVPLDQQHYRPIQLRGRWIPSATVFLDNRPWKGRAGFIVVTPLELPDGRAVLVQRGWMPRDFQDRQQIVPPPTPAGEVRSLGRIAPPPARLYEFDGAASGPIRQNLDLASYAAETRLKLLPVSVQLLDVPGTPAAADGLVRDWPLPASDVHKHYGYAAQWFALCALTLALYVWFQIIVPRRRRT